jgi:hypothetical protein
MVEWFSFSVAWLAVIVSGFIAYHIYFLQKRVSFRGDMEHRAEIQAKVETLLVDVMQGLSGRVELVNAKQYRGSSFSSSGDSYRDMSLEVKGYSQQGVEFFDKTQVAYYTEEGELTLERTDRKGDFNIFSTGVIPYEWIKYADLRGDTTAYSRPQFFVYCNAADKTPFKSKYHYVWNDLYNDTIDPHAMRYKPVDVI